MKWYFCLNENALPNFAECIVAAVNSCLQNTSLEPNFLYDGSPNAFTDYLVSRGVKVHFHRLSFLSEIESSTAQNGFNKDVARGAYLRLDIPLVEREAQHVLYTDADVIFLAEPEFERLPQVFAAAEEYDHRDGKSLPYAKVFNSGVMLLNLEGFRRERDGLLEVARQNQFYFHGDGGYYDQGALNRHFAGRFDTLPQSLNWRPFAGCRERPVIVHFHGTKPWEIARFVRGQAIERGVARQMLSQAPAVYLAVYATFLRFVDAEGLAAAQSSCALPVQAADGDVFEHPERLPAYERLGDLHGFFFDGEWIYPQHFYGHDYTRQLLEVLKRACRGRERLSMLEWGSGFSTLAAQHLFARLLRSYRIDTVDNYQPYQDAVKAATLGGRTAQVRFHLADVTGPGRSQADPELAYSTLPLAFGVRYDLIFIDGRRRMECAFIAAMLAHEDATIVLHDFRRGRYQPILALFEVVEDYGQFRVMRVRPELRRIADEGLARVCEALQPAA